VQLGFMNRALPGLGPMDPLGMTQLQVMQMVPTAGKLGLAGAAAEARVGGTRARALDLRWEVRSQVAAAFYEVYRTERSIEIALGTRRLMEDVASTSEAMYRVGETAQADVLKARVEVSRMTEDITAMRAMRAVNLARLGGLLNQPVDSTATAVLPAYPDRLPPLDSLIGQAATVRPMVQAGEADLRAAEADARLATREIWPDLQVGVQYGQRGGMSGVERMGSLMLGASVPIFAKSRQYRMRDETGAMRAMAAADLAAMKAETRAKVGEAYAEWTRARNLRSLYLASVLPQARAAVTASLAAYRVGRVNLMTLLDNQATVNRYEQELASLDAAEGMALADLEMLLGRELFDPNAGRATPGGNR
jgi:outer membrane protein TolC